LAGLEGSSPGYVARLLLNMKPPVETPLPEGATPGLYALTTPGIAGEPDVKYLVQLPPRYDPYRRYPTIVTLNGSGTTPSQQIDWWAGAYSAAAQMRLGQGTRHGYIVIAPVWSKKHQYKFEYSAQEHAAVLFSLRDACRRFSIDTDRVFLSGHSMGGDAAWDIALAHPDLWAGAMPIVATGEKYVSRYWENAKAVPLYFVGGELDGNRMATNALHLDRYMKRAGYDVMVVEFLGRGHEHFIDEVQRLFEWMALHKRSFFPKEFNAVSMRDWDNFFWWAEVDDMPSRSTVLPFRWPPPAGTQPVKIEGKLQPGNRVSLRTGAGRATIYLSPEMVDFEQRIEVSVNGRTHRESIRQEVEVLLEDARTRADRQHPFHAKIELSTGRGGR
jgi:predicted esterase